MMKSKLIFVALAGLAFASTSCFFSGSPGTWQQQSYQDPDAQEYYGEQTVVTSSVGETYGTAEAGPLGSSATVVGPNGEVISVSVTMTGTGMMDTQIYDNTQMYDNSYQQQQTGGHHHGGRGGGGCYAMGIVDFSKYYDTMKAKNFDEHKVDQAKLSARSGACFDVDQIVKLLQLLNFDAKRVEMAVALYPITADPQNWYQLANAFQFESNYQEVVRQTIGD